MKASVLDDFTTAELLDYVQERTMRDDQEWCASDRLPDERLIGTVLDHLLVMSNELDTWRDVNNTKRKGESNEHHRDRA